MTKILNYILTVSFKYKNKGKVVVPVQTTRT